MKGGLAVITYALKGLFRANALPRYPIVFMLGADEEQGSVSMAIKHTADVDNFYVWALSFISEEIDTHYVDLRDILVKKKIFRACSALIQKKYAHQWAAQLGAIFKTRAMMMLNPYRKQIVCIARKLSPSSRYWEKRFCSGGNSGKGSYGKLARYKAEMINTFIQTHHIKQVIDFGCGDGHQASLFQVPRYIGLDVSKTAINLCRERFDHDATRQFIWHQPRNAMGTGQLPKADLTLSLDVLSYLVEDHIFENHIHHLFNHSKQYVIIFSPDFKSKHDSPHKLDRKFTPIIKKRIPNFFLKEIVINPYKGYETMSDFFIYEKIG